MVAGIVAAPAVNGMHPAPPLPSDLAEYEKIIRLRDDVLAGRHPRLKAVVSSGAVAFQQGSSAVNAPAFNSNHATSSSPFPAQNAHASLPSSLPPGKPGQPGGTRNAALPGLVPALLSGPPLLTPADRNLSRSVIQAHLINEIKMKPRQWPKLDRENILPDFDVDDLLRKAHAQVKPMAFDKAQAKERSSARASPDDNNSYYSSQVNDDDESGEIRMGKTTRPCTFHFKGKCNRGEACNFSHDPAFEAQLKPIAASTQAAAVSEKQHINEGPPHKRSRYDDGYNLDQPSSGVQKRVVDEFGRTIPPSRLAGMEAANAEVTGHNRSPPSAYRQNGDRRFSGRAAPPTRDGPIIRNQILSPVAPQPARVSPLASKGAGHIEHTRNFSGHSAQHSPITTQPLSRKRRRDHEGEGHDAAYIRRRVESPSVRIKEEPMSPRALEGVPQYRYVSRNDDSSKQPIMVESYPYGSRRVEQDGQREIHYVDDPGYRRVSSPMVRVVSRAEPRFEVRREPELRRVVSERNPLRGASPALHSPRGPAFYEDGQRSGVPPSVVFLSRGDNDAPNGYRASMAPPSQANQRSGLESSRPEFVEPRRVQSPALHQNMPPPPVRRIIRDQYGNEFYEPAPESQRFSVAPEPRYAPEHAYAARPVSRMTSVMPEPSRQAREGTVLHRRDEQEPTSPRYVGGPPGGRAPSAAPYARREAADYVAERPQVVRLDDGGGRGDEPYERVIYRQGPPQAMYADRPRESFYEPQREAIYRMPSARPDAVRYGSMAPATAQRYEYVDERPSRQYVQSGQDRQYVME